MHQTDGSGDRVRRKARPQELQPLFRRRRELLTELGPGEAAWAYQYRPAMSDEIKKRQEGLSEEVKEIAWKAQHRLCTRYRRLLTKGKLKQKMMIAIGRELLGFVWAIGIQVEREQRCAGSARRVA